MDTIKVHKEELLNIIESNREKHVEDFKKSIKAYRVKAADLFTKELEKMVNGEEFATNIRLDKPESHIKDYDLIIGMLKMSVDDIVELEWNQFNQYVNDEWNWKPYFKTSVYSNSAYFGMTRISGTTMGMQGMGGTSGSSGSSDVEIKFSKDETD